ncbi:MAG: type III pantothenate kinase [Lysobacteraceae bacterium]
MDESKDWLLFDAGNTRLKWACTEADGIVERGAMDWSALQHAGWQQALPNTSQGRQVALAQVLSPEHAEVLRDALLGRFGRVREVRSEASCAGLRSAYRHSERLGVDRWLGMLAAWQPGEALLLANVGTALTLDAVDAQGQHLGGSILAGLQAMQGGLLNAAPGLQRLMGVDDAECRLWADDSAAAIRSAPVFAVTAMIEMAVRRLRRQLQMPVRCVIAGGDAAVVQAQLEIDCEVRRDLVLEGLWKRVRMP